MRKGSNWFSIAIGLLLVACNPVANLEGAENKIERFQGVYSAGSHDELYRMTGRKFREVTSREQFQDLVDLFDARLGRVVETERSGFNVNTMNGITTTVVSMTTQFAQGEGLETYTFHGHGEDIQLVGWNVNSPRLALSMDEIRLLNEAREASAEAATD